MSAPLTAAAVAALVRSRQRSATAVVEETLATIAARNPTLNAFAEVLPQRARARAAAIDAQLAAGHDPGPLAGVPFGVKNLFDVKGLATLAGSKINADRAPAEADALLIERLEAAGAILVGTLHMGEYAYDFTGENSHYGPTCNPIDPRRMSGGSSGGSGSAVGGQLVPLALGSDTNGSIRVPSALCGVFGLKPTYGRLSRRGSFLFSPSLDHLGPLGRSTADLALAFDAMQGPDPLDPACSAQGIEPTVAGLRREGELRLAMAGDYFACGASAEALAAVAKAATTLGVDKTLTLPEAARARAAAYVITALEAGQLHLPRLKSRAVEFDPAVRDRLLAGAISPAAWYLQAQRFRRWFQRRMLALFHCVDVIIAPATPCTAPLLGQKSMVINGVEVLIRPNLGLYTQPISFIGLPVVVAPIQGVSTLPIGVQLIAPPGRELWALQVAQRLEQQGVAKAWSAPAHPPP